MTSEEHKAKQRVYNQRYYEAHRAEILAASNIALKKRVKTPEGKVKKAQRAKRHYKQHPELYRAAGKLHRERYPREEADRKARWRRENPTKTHAEKVRRKMRRRVAFIEDIDIDVLFVRDRGICQLCGHPVVERAGKMRPSEDHIIPLVLGGTHCYTNVQLAHLSCNAAKGASRTSRIAVTR